MRRANHTRSGRGVNMRYRGGRSGSRTAGGVYGLTQGDENGQSCPFLGSAFLKLPAGSVMDFTKTGHSRLVGQAFPYGPKLAFSTVEWWRKHGRYTERRVDRELPRRLQAWPPHA